MSNARDEKFSAINLLMRVLGVERVLRSGVVTPVLPYARPTKFQITQPEVAAAMEEMSDFDDWPGSWEKVAFRNERLGLHAEELKSAITAKRAFVHASYLYHLAQLYSRDTDMKTRLHKKSVETYRRASRHFSPSAQPQTIRFEGLAVPGYLRIPNTHRQTPWVILIDGADTTKEEAHYQAEAFLERGLAVFYFDGPGQGELRDCSNLQLGQYERAISEIITTLGARYPSLSKDKIGVYGISTGGYLALRAAIFDSRIMAVASVGGFIDARGYFSSPITTQQSMSSLFGKPSIEEMGRFIREEIDIKHQVRTLERPILAVYGGRDHLVPREEIDDLARACGSWVTTAIFKNGTHALQNVDPVVRELVPDWMVSALIDKPIDISFVRGLW